MLTTLDRNKLLLMAIIIASTVYTVEAQTNSSEKPAEHNKYSIQFKIDFDHLSYEGAERVRWINRGEKPSSVVYFHLYPNLRVNDPESGISSTEADEPVLDVTEVRSVQGDTPLFFFLDDQATTLRVNLREPVPPGGATE